MNLGLELLAAAAAFVATDIDDLALLVTLFADRRWRARAIVLGQFLGISALVLLSSAAALALLKIPLHWTALLGVVPIAVGCHSLLRHRSESDAQKAAEPRRSIKLQTIAVAGITFANGGDNLAIYIPLFASSPQSLLLYAIVFGVMTAVWCMLGYWAARRSLLAIHLHRYGDLFAPIVLIVLGFYILVRGFF